MTDQDWLTATDPAPMLDYLHGRISDRKLLLFAAACCRQIWALLGDERCRQAVVVAERFADGRADVKELATIRTAVVRVEKGPADRAAYWTAHPHPSETIWNVHTASAEAVMSAAIRGVAPRQQADAWDAAGIVARQAQAEMLRDIVGNPFRAIRINPIWLTWGGGTVRRIASHIYVERRFEDLPVLADALEDAGCDDSELLTHCRADVVHVRGCWAVDALV